MLPAGNEGEPLLCKVEVLQDYAANKTINIVKFSRYFMFQLVGGIGFKLAETSKVCSGRDKALAGISTRIKPSFCHYWCSIQHFLFPKLLKSVLIDDEMMVTLGMLIKSACLNALYRQGSYIKA